MKNPNRLVPEVKFKAQQKHRAGFVPNFTDSDDDVELWQIWMHSSDGEQSRRATFADLDKAGFQKRKK